MKGTVLHVNVGAPRQVDWKGKLRTSAIWKSPVAGRVPVQGTNLKGDDQADRKVHGGPRKAVYAYAEEDYEWWELEIGKRLAPGTFGENLTIKGIDISTAVVGERWKIGGAILEVTQPRFPCWKLGMRMGDPKFPKRFLKAERSGAYLSVIKEGDVGAGDSVEVVFRPDHPISVGLLAHLNSADRPGAELLLQAAGQLDLSSEEWSALLEGREPSLGP